MRPAPLLLAALLLAPGALSATAPTAAPLTQDGGPGPCTDVPLVVGECGDTMEGDLGFQPGTGAVFPAGRLLGDPEGLTFGGVAVCLANATTSGCSGGDITSVTAGPGLSGGGLTGAVTLAVDFTATQQRVAGTCAAGTYLRVVHPDGTVTCGADANSGGTVTSVASGAGLAGGPITSAGTLSIATGGVTSAMVADGTLVAADVNAGSIQRRVTGSCVAGAYVRVVNQDGSVTCGTDANSGGTVTTVSSGAGLTGGPITTNGTLSIATGGVTSAMVADGNVTTPDLADDAVTGAKVLDGTITGSDVNPASVQRRVQGTCAVGNYVRIVAEDGEVTCGTDADSGGTVTQVNAGAGLTGGPITTTGTISIVAGGVTTTMVADGTLTAADLAGNAVTSAKILDATVATADLANGAVTGAKTDASQVQARVTGTCAQGSAVQTITQAGAVTCGSFPGDFWRLGGNANTTPGDFLGTLDNTSLELRVNGSRALRLQPGTTVPGYTDGTASILGGSPSNTVDPGLTGAFIGGGGAAGGAHRVSGAYGVVAGGYNNSAASSATVSGGSHNAATADWASVGGGLQNAAKAYASTIGGGEGNEVVTGMRNTVGGGGFNQVSGDSATVAGGYNNRAGGFASAVAGGAGNNASGAYAAVIGGTGNLASGDDSVVLGGNNNIASGKGATAGGSGAIASGDDSFALGVNALAAHAGSFVFADSTNSGIAFQSTAANQFLIQASNGVGIGTQRPTATIGMGGDVSRSIKMERRLDALGGLPLSIEAGGAKSGTTNLNGGLLMLSSGIATGTGSSIIAFATAAPGASGTGDRFPTTRMTLTGTGDLGLGTTAPPDNLTVRGDVRVGNSGTNGCVKRFDGTALTGVCSSDARLKKDVAPFEPVLDRLVMLQPSTYAWRADEFPEHAFGTERTYGLIAQEVQATFPEMVGADAHGFLAVDYSRLPLLLLQAVKDLEQRNDALEGENQALRAQLAGIAERVERLERSMDP